MITRPSRNERVTRRRRERALASPARPPELAATAEPASIPPGQQPRERRDVDPTEDTAVYNCGCGMVFDAPVSTSVGCPHCGASQAW